MGWAARAKEHDWQNGKSVSRGNPDKAAQRVTVICDDKFNLGNRRATFSDREYVMDQFGTLRRVLVVDREPTVTFSVSRDQS